MNMNDFVILPGSKAGTSQKLKTKTVKELQLEKVQLETENREMEKRLQQLQSNMSREKEERKKLGAYRWKSGQAGPRTSQAQALANNNVNRKKVSPEKVKLQILKEQSQVKRPVRRERGNVAAREKCEVKGVACGPSEIKGGLLEPASESTCASLGKQDKELLLSDGYDKEAAAKSFREILLQWRKGRRDPGEKPRTREVPSAESVGFCEVQTNVTVQKKPIHIKFEKDGLSYMEQLLLKKYRRTPVDQMFESCLKDSRPVQAPNVHQVGTGGGKQRSDDLDDTEDLTDEEVKKYWASVYKVEEPSTVSEHAESSLKIEFLDDSHSKELEELSDSLVEATGAVGMNKQGKTDPLEQRGSRSPVSPKEISQEKLVGCSDLERNAVQEECIEPKTVRRSLSSCDLPEEISDPTEAENHQDLLETELRNNQDLLEAELRNNQDLLEAELRNNQDLLEAELRNNQDLLETELRNNQDLLGTELRNNQDLLETELRNNQDLLEAELRNNQDLLEAELRNNQDLLESELRNNQDLLETELRNNQDLLETEISGNQDLLESELRSNQDLLEAELRSNQDLLEAELRNNQDLLKAELRRNQDLLETELGSNQDLLETELRTNQDPLEAELWNNQDLLEAELRNNQQDLLEAELRSNQDLLETHVQKSSREPQELGSVCDSQSSVLPAITKSSTLQDVAKRQKPASASYQGLEGFFAVGANPEEGKLEAPSPLSAASSPMDRSIPFPGDRQWVSERSLSEYADDSIVQGVIESELNRSANGFEAQNKISPLTVSWMPCPGPENDCSLTCEGETSSSSPSEKISGNTEDFQNTLELKDHDTLDIFGNWDESQVDDEEAILEDKQQVLALP